MATKKLAAPVSVGRRLNFAASVASSVAGKLLEPHELTLAQWAVLVALWSNGALSVKDLSTLTGNAPPATSRIVDRMMAGGLLVRRQAADDRRAVVIEPSDAGNDLQHLKTVYEQVNAIMLDGLSDAERGQLFALLEKVEANGRTWLAGQKR